MLGLTACGDDYSKSTVTETVTTPAQAEPGAPTTTPAPQKTPGSGSDGSNPGGSGSDQKDGPGTGGTQAKCPPGQIPVIATGGCAKE